VLTGDLGFRRSRGSSVGVLAAAVAPGNEEGADKVQNVMAKGVARSYGPRWPAEKLRCGLSLRGRRALWVVVSVLRNDGFAA
jgi:hypothetical protein